LGSKMPLDVTAHQLKRAWLQQRNAAAALTPTHKSAAALLNFYAVECGLKAVLVRQLRVQTIAQVEGFKEHDIRYFMKKLRMSALHVSGIRSCRTTHKPSRVVEVSELHQAWRYGQELDADDEAVTLRGIDSLQDWLADRLGGRHT
jgi:hypothetical protein